MPAFYFSYFTQKKAFQKLWKIVFISSNKHFSFLRYSMFCFFSFSLQFPDSKSLTKKWIFVNMFCNSKRQVTSSTSFLFFIILSIKWTGCKGKNQVTFFMVSFKITYFQKSLTCIGCFGLFTKTRKGYGSSF